ncbi:hypothetical protein [Alkalicoccobacillus gibsonii]|uniref:hypothetical protein n=1 Tax=Alkalicoccobacillus gibsonii TaxID=79881 RepID=UPI001934AF6A|nr:hypothetical protein [Alkalicoccobacillus gibsonii]MBM0064911.1 hypothetical protein [Alkalicoccobacillus gibsonii]
MSNKTLKLLLVLCVFIIGGFMGYILFGGNGGSVTANTNESSFFSEKEPELGDEEFVSEYEESDFYSITNEYGYEYENILKLEDHFLEIVSSKSWRAISKDFSENVLRDEPITSISEISDIKDYQNGLNYEDQYYEYIISEVQTFLKIRELYSGIKSLEDYINVQTQFPGAVVPKDIKFEIKNKSIHTDLITTLYVNDTYSLTFIDEEEEFLYVVTGNAANKLLRENKVETEAMALKLMLQQDEITLNKGNTVIFDEYELYMSGEVYTFRLITDIL